MLGTSLAFTLFAAAAPLDLPPVPIDVPPDDVLTVETVAPDALVLRVGLVGSYWAEDSPADVSVYADRRVIVVDPDQPHGYATFVIDGAALAELLGVAARARPFDSVDFGEVQITDVGSTRVEVHTDRGDSVREVWALGEDDGLSGAQRDSRRRLQALVDALEGLASNADDSVAFVSEDVEVTLRPVLPGMGPEGTPSAWPLAERPVNHHGAGTFHDICFAVPSAAVEEVPAETDGGLLWTLPSDLHHATPPLVAASIIAVLPDEEPCDGFTPVEEPRPLTEEELASPSQDWTSPWPPGTRTTISPYEEWMAVDSLARTVLPAQLGGSWDWSRWSWFDHRVVAADVEGRRVVDVHATCSELVTDEEPACTIDARFDATTGELLALDAV